MSLSSKGWNTTLTFQTHKGTIPTQPALGRALAALKIVVQAPRLHAPHNPDDPNSPSQPGDDDDGRPHFIREAVMHLFSSTATFTLLSPFAQTTMYITHVNATALYKGDTVGHIYYGSEFSGVPDEFEVPPGLSQTPRLPVDWSLGSVGYDAIKKALGGSLRLRAEAVLGVKIGEWTERIWFKGRGIGAKVRM